MTVSSQNDRPVSLRAETGPDGALTLTLSGRLDSETAATVWSEATQAVERGAPPVLVVDGSDVAYCDGSGIGLLVELRRRQEGAGRKFQVRGLAGEFRRLLDMFDPAEFAGALRTKRPRTGIFTDVGIATAALLEDLRDLVVFVGELSVNLVRSLAHPSRIRWKDAWLVAELAGVNAFSLVALIGFLMGLIMAFQAATAMRPYGLDIYAANLVALSMLRELGPLMTSIVLAGRSGSAFAAEIGTMKINEEIDALNTMGLDPVRFLVTPRVIAAVFMIPFLTVFANLFGLIGGAVVLRSLGYPLVTYVNQILADLGGIRLTDLIGGLVKSFVFGILVAGVGCLRGLQTRIGASAVGDSTTSAVVSGIVLIAIADGIFAVVYYYLGV